MQRFVDPAETPDRQGFPSFDPIAEKVAAQHLRVTVDSAVLQKQQVFDL